MASLFAAYESLVSEAIDRVYGESTRIEYFKKDKVFGSDVDSERPAFDIIGIPDFNPVTVTTKDEGSYDGFQPTIAANRIHISYDLSLFQDPSQYPSQNAVITLLERAGTPRVTVMAPPEHDGIGRILCVCAKK